MKRLTCVLLLPLLAAACTAAVGNGDGDGNGSQNGQNGTGGQTTVDPSNPGVAVLPGGLELDGAPVYYRFVRLTHSQWENSVRDVLMLSTVPGQATGFVPDPPDGKFSNNERALYVTDSLRLDYQRAAEAVAESVAADATALGRLAAPGDSAGFISAVGRRAYRRPLTADEIATFETLWASGATFFASGDDFADGARIFLEGLLQSPKFLYRAELTPDGMRLSGYELATKLSYLLRDTTPSDVLLDAAAGGELDSDQGLATLAQQMLDEDGARGVLERFHSELLGLSRYESILKDATAFPAYSEDINSTLLEADMMFFDRIYEQGFGLREILTSNVAYVDQATAGFYGISATGPGLTEVTLDASRPGFLTRLGFLAYNATLVNPDPIHRGVDINNRLLCAKLEPPAGEIPPLPDPIPGQTNRERVTAHTGQGVCAGCHGKIINPLGFALENFDAMGQVRTTDNGKPVDTTGEYAFTDGLKSFNDVTELVGLLADSQQAHGCYSANLAEFALARDVAGGEGQLVEGMQTISMDDDASVKQLLLATVQSPIFTTAKAGAQ